MPGEAFPLLPPRYVPESDPAVEAERELVPAADSVPAGDDAQSTPSDAQAGHSGTDEEMAPDYYWGSAWAGDNARQEATGGGFSTPEQIEKTATDPAHRGAVDFVWHNARAPLHRELRQVRKFADDSERACLEVIDERDQAHEQLDALAVLVGELVGADMGEHSNANDPWRNALDALRGFVEGCRG